MVAGIPIVELEDSRATWLDRGDEHVRTAALQGTSDADSSARDAPIYALEDVLLTVAVAAFGLEERFTLRDLCDIAQVLLEARTRGRAHEQIHNAHAEAAALQPWKCQRCDEANPATFDVCWNCSSARPADAACLQPEAEALLACDAVARFGVLAENGQQEREG